MQSSKMLVNKAVVSGQDNKIYGQMMSASPSALLLKDLYARMLLTRIVDDCAWRMHDLSYIDFSASCRGHEAAQVGSAICIEVGKDFTLPYYRDLGVMLTIGMTPYEVFRNYLQAYASGKPTDAAQELHWGYHKHNTVTGPTPMATQILHAAGIAFACKLRKAHVVTIAYCSDGISAEADFREGIRFAALHQLPVIFVCEEDGTRGSSAYSCMQKIDLPAGLARQRIDGADIIEVYTTMQAAMQRTREGHGPILLELSVTRSTPAARANRVEDALDGDEADPLKRCQQYLQQQGMWDEAWAAQLYTRYTLEVERAMQDAIRDTLL
ncbi:MAG: thiamine pyrophosphate-dependent enzyme [Chloroflexota bacterium]|nr:thiamine pyrophosphate-dependent enzyme [Chloroflexota bacterium]